MNYIFKNKKWPIGIILFFSFSLIGEMMFPAPAFAASRIYFESPAADIAPGSSVSVSVLLNTEVPINVFDLEITYPKDTLQFLNFDNTDSVVDFWQTSPLVLPNGNLGLSGGIIKSFTGNKGLLIKITFKALQVGQPQLSFLKSSLAVADGRGTEVKADSGTFSFSIKEDAAVVSSPIVPFESTPTDILIKEELETLRTRMLWKKMLPALVVFLIIFVICAVAVYNKLKRKL